MARKDYTNPSNKRDIKMKISKALIVIAALLSIDLRALGNSTESSQLKTEESSIEDLMTLIDQQQNYFKSESPSPGLKTYTVTIEGDRKIIKLEESFYRYSLTTFFNLEDGSVRVNNYWGMWIEEKTYLPNTVELEEFLIGLVENMESITVLEGNVSLKEALINFTEEFAY